jgi:hypothetical protein
MGPSKVHLLCSLKGPHGGQDSIPKHTLPWIIAVKNLPSLQKHSPLISWNNQITIPKALFDSFTKYK